MGGSRGPGPLPTPDRRSWPWFRRHFWQQAQIDDVWAKARELRRKLGLDEDR